jgi:protein-disulfide isomerase
MPRKKTEKIVEILEEENEEVIIEPQISQVLPSIAVPRNYTPYYVLLLIVFAYLLGALTTKLQYGAGTATDKNQPIPTQAAQQPQGPAAHVEVANGHFPVLGQDSAKITIVEFADPRCPFCKQFFTDVFPQLKADYIDTGKVKMYFRNFDFLGAPSTVAGNALECANEQGKFWDMHDYLYKNQPVETDTSLFTPDNLTPIAGNLGLNTDQFNSCLSSNKDNNAVTQDYSDGQKAGVSGTPTFFINGTSLVGAQPYTAFKTIIDQELTPKK